MFRDLCKWVKMNNKFIVTNVTYLSIIKFLFVGVWVGLCVGLSVCGLGCCVSTYFVLISMGCLIFVVIHKNKQLLLKKYFDMT